MITNIGDVKELNGNIFLIGRQNKNKVILKRKKLYYPYKNFFYIKKDKEKNLDMLQNLELHKQHTNKKSLFGDEIIQVFYKITSKEDYETISIFIKNNREDLFEADIFDRVLFCLDELPHMDDVNLDLDWRKVYIDIETKSLGPISNPNNPTDEVLCVTIFDSYDGKYHFFYVGDHEFISSDVLVKCKTETQMLIETIKYLGSIEPDVIMGWNVHFDISYLLNRYKKLTNDITQINKLSKVGYVSYDEKRKQYSIFGLVIFDLLKGYMRVHRLGVSGYSLDNVASEELGERKIEVDIKSLYKLPIEKLYEYNRKDVELCILIDKKLHIFDFHDSMRKFIGCPYDSVEYASNMIDFLLLKKARELNIVLPTKSDDMSKKMKFEGAFVDAIPGKYHNVINFDISAMYPSIIKTFNLSMECIDPNGEIKVGKINITKNKKGMIPMIIDDLLVMRKEYDNKRDEHPYGHPDHERYDILVESVKCVIDAVYGVNAYPRFRLFRGEIAEGITYLGREIIKRTREKLQEMGYKVVITDTDSTDFYVSKDKSIPEIEEEGYRVLDIINKDYPIWANKTFGIDIDKCYIKNVFKKIYSRVIVGAKKRYVCKVVWSKGKLSSGIEIIGFHNKRSDCSRFGRDLQLQLIHKLLDDESDLQILTFLNEKIKEMKTLTPTQLAIPTKIEKNLDEYTTNLPKKRGASYSSKIIGESFYVGDKPLLLFTQGESDVILFFKNYQAELLLKRVKINWNKMIERNIFLVSDLLLENCGMNKVLECLRVVSTGQKTLGGYI